MLLHEMFHFVYFLKDLCHSVINDCTVSRPIYKSRQCVTLPQRRPFHLVLRMRAPVKDHIEEALRLTLANQVSFLPVMIIFVTTTR